METNFANKALRASPALPSALPPDFGKWCVYVLILLLPGSFAVVALIWLARYVTGAVANRARVMQTRAALH